MPLTSEKKKKLLALAEEFFRFGIIGLVGLAVDTAFTYLGIYVFRWGHYISGFFAFPFAVTVTWVGNRLFTFRNIVHEPMAKQWAKFASVCTVGIVINRGTYSLMIASLPLAYDHPVIALCGGSIAAMFFNFFSSKKVVFKNS